MSISRDNVNPLRPYSIPPTIGDPADPAGFAPDSKSLSGINTTSHAGYASRARDALVDLDYQSYLGSSSPSVGQSIKEFVDELLWKYASVLMAQPFEVAKMILQTRSQVDVFSSLSESNAPLARSLSKQSRSEYDNQDSDSEGDELAYFTSRVLDTPTPSYRRGNPRGCRQAPSLRSPPITRHPVGPEHQLNLRRSDSILEVLGQLRQKNGAWGVWKGSNATFLYNVLQSLLENWSRSFISAIFNVPDLGVKENIDRLVDIVSPYPWVSLFIAGAAAVATGLLLSPLDLVRTSSHGQRRTLASLRSLPSYLCPSAIAIPTILNSLVHPLLTLSTPLILRTRFLLDSQASPITFSIAKFLASSAAILIKLPLETVLRRGQMAVLLGEAYCHALSTKGQVMDTIAPVGRYEGVWGTMRHIVTEEGSREVPVRPAAAKQAKARGRSLQPTYRKGRGLEGLWRGWKVNWWGLVGLWTASIVGHGGEGEF